MIVVSATLLLLMAASIIAKPPTVLVYGAVIAFTCAAYIVYGELSVKFPSRKSKLDDDNGFSRGDDNA
jgi:hypothetical protein